MRTLLAGLVLLTLTTMTPSAEALTVEMTRTFLENGIGREGDEFEPVVTIHVDTTPVTSLVEIGLVIGSHVSVIDGETLFFGPSGGVRPGSMFEVNGPIDGSPISLGVDGGRITGNVSGFASEVLCFETLCMDSVLVDAYGFPEEFLVMGPGTWVFQSHDGGPPQRQIAYGTYRLVDVAQVPGPPTAALLLAGAAVGVGLLRLARGARSRT